MRAGRPASPFPPGGFVAMAHRGGALLRANRGRENTVHAFTEATRLGYRHLETDVHTTADGVLVAFHDTVLDRVTDATGEIAGLPWAEVRRARVGGQDPIPTLDELLETFPEAVLNLDIKAPGAVAPLAETLRRHAATGRVCVGSFSLRRLSAFRALAGASVATSATQLEVVLTRLGLPFAGRGPAVALQVPVRHRILGVDVPVVTRGLVERAHAAGRQVHVWTVDAEDEMHRLVDLGVDGLVSDAIDTLKRVLTARGLWA
ncbi:glycerophosphodiester phosphodiesterase [Desertihabitans brevis]|nr:glycerophosphodiester phosphodiesterase [Desertihabitans brevis]